MTNRTVTVDTILSAKARRRRQTTQRGNIGGQLLFAIVIIALFFGFLYWYAQHTDGQGPPPADTPGPVQPGDDVPQPDDPADDDSPGVDPEPPAPADPDPVDPPPPSADLADETGAVFSYMPVGELLPSSGPGFSDAVVYRPGLRFPTEDRVYLNSQVYRHGGMNGHLNGMNGGQCEAANYRYPWQDTFCEKRDRNQPLCPGGGHEGLDIRPATCAKNVHWAVAVEGGRIIDIRRHWVTLQTPDGAIFNYLHLNMSALSVSVGQTVTKGQRIGRISNDFYKSDGTSVPTTTHLHFEMYENYAAAPGEEPVFTKVNPYMTLVNAYDRKLRGVP